MTNSAQQAHVDTLKAVALTIRPALQRLPGIEETNKCQRALNVLVKNLDELWEALR